MGRNKKYQTEEERLEAKRKREVEYYQANKLKRSLYYKERYKNLKDESEENVVTYRTPTTPKKVTVYGKPSVEEEVEEVHFEAFNDDTSGNYEGTIT
jgi:hypothetical protein